MAQVNKFIVLFVGIPWAGFIVLFVGIPWAGFIVLFVAIPWAGFIVLSVAIPWGPQRNVSTAVWSEDLLIKGSSILTG